MIDDRTGDIDAKMWDNVAEVMDTFERDDFVKVKGLLNRYNGRFQLTIHKLRKMEDSEIEFADYGIDRPTAPLVLSVEDRGVMELQLVFRRS